MSTTATLERPNDTQRLLYSVDEARAQLGGLSKTELYDQMRDGKLSYVKIGRRRMISRDALHDFIRRVAVVPAPAPAVI